MHRWSLLLVPALFLATGLTATSNSDSDAAARGARAVRGQPPLTAALFSRAAVDNAWKRWGLAGKPADFDRLFRERYGLHPADYENHGLPMGLHEARGVVFGKGVANDCLLCHASSFAGQTVMGMGNASLDIQTMFEELFQADGNPFDVPFQASNARGTIDPVSPVTFLMSFRDAELNLQKPADLDKSRDLCSDPPAWWQLKKKKIRNWTGSLDARSTRVDMVNLLTAYTDAESIKKKEGAFADIHAFVLTTPAPKYPFPVDAALAQTGNAVFEKTCSRCHGTYGAAWTYPNKVVPLDTIGTDRLLAEAITPRNLDYINASWFARELDPDGKPYRITPPRGYLAPPLDGVWATAPYLHNASVPTVYHVLNSKARPRYFTRSYRTERDDYDPAHLGWKFTALDRPADADRPVVERRRVYDTTQPGRSNGGHTFGDELTDAERWAVIEYLKTL